MPPKSITCEIGACLTWKIIYVFFFFLKDRRPEEKRFGTGTRSATLRRVLPRPSGRQLGVVRFALFDDRRMVRGRRAQTRFVGRHDTAAAAATFAITITTWRWRPSRYSDGRHVRRRCGRVHSACLDRGRGGAVAVLAATSTAVGLSRGRVRNRQKPFRPADGVVGHVDRSDHMALWIDQILYHIDNFTSVKL